MIRDEDIIRIEEPKLSLAERLYLPQILGGLWVTLRHVFKRKITVQYPEQRRSMYRDNYRGVHRLNKDAQGRVKCVACFMCETACPAHCIHIVGAESPWPDREKYPVRFDIDELRCIYCGMCEEACPVDAIELTPLHDMVGQSRAEMVFDKEKLLGVFDQTRDLKPPKNPRIVGYAIDNPDYQLGEGPGRVPLTPPLSPKSRGQGSGGRGQSESVPAPDPRALPPGKESR
ncbi:MAG: NAD(P)H-quinone oxidoreductase subunit I, chloroplastic [Phycisphaerae bacterium]|nr:NAD(P)H-quinone oxidoreductase subunit I, chloroplastic [Phycisphaerae bacterium]